MIPGAATEVAVDTVTDLVLCRAGVVLEQPYCGHDHPRRTETALQAVALPEALLNGMQCVAVGQALDRLDVGTIRLNGQNHARFRGCPVDNDRAGSAVAGLTPDMGSSQKRLIPNEVNEKCAGLHIPGDRLPVHGHGYLHMPPVRRTSKETSECGFSMSDKVRKPETIREQASSTGSTEAGKGLILTLAGLVGLFAVFFTSLGVAIVTGSDLRPVGNLAAPIGILAALYVSFDLFNDTFLFQSSTILWGVVFLMIAGFTYGKVSAKNLGYALIVTAVWGFLPVVYLALEQAIP